MKALQTYEKFQCSRCGSTEFEQTLTPPPHYAKLVCARCGAFQRWLPKPETIIEGIILRETITRLMNAPLTQKEREFILSLTPKQKLSPKQKSWLESIANKHLKTKGV